MSALCTWATFHPSVGQRKSPLSMVFEPLILGSEVIPTITSSDFVIVPWILSVDALTLHVC